MPLWQVSVVGVTRLIGRWSAADAHSDRHPNSKARQGNIESNDRHCRTNEQFKGNQFIMKIIQGLWHSTWLMIDDSRTSKVKMAGSYLLQHQMICHWLKHAGLELSCDFESSYRRFLRPCLFHGRSIRRQQSHISNETTNLGRVSQTGSIKQKKSLSCLWPRQAYKYIRSVPES